jgi:hypothetical protein
MLPTMSPILTNQESRVGANDTVIITFVLDGGATHLLTGTCYSDLLHGAMPSNMTVTGFNSNDAPLQGEMFGTFYMHAVGIENEDAVGAYKMSMTTVPGLAFNLFPASAPRSSVTVYHRARSSLSQVYPVGGAHHGCYSTTATTTALSAPICAAWRYPKSMYGHHSVVVVGSIGSNDQDRKTAILESNSSRFERISGAHISMHRLGRRARARGRVHACVVVRRGPRRARVPACLRAERS